MREIVIACGEYDRTAAIMQHTISMDGVPYHYLPLSPAETFWRMIRYAEFDVCEMSLGSYCTMVGQGDNRFVALPVFPSRAFRHGNLFVREDSPLQDPSELKGCRVGVAEYEMTAGIWIRGILKDEYGVDVRDVEWVTGREEKASGIPYDPTIRLSFRRNLEEALERGEIDALATAPLPQALGRGVRRLIPDYRQREIASFRQTRVFPIMHTLVLRREVHEAFPFLARTLAKAFTQAKLLAQEQMYRTNALPYTLPWMVPLIEETISIMGPDPWPYGVKDNEPTLLTFTRYLEEQSLTRGRLGLEQLFVPDQWTNSRTRSGKRN